MFKNYILFFGLFLLTVSLGAQNTQKTDETIIEVTPELTISPLTKYRLMTNDRFSPDWIENLKVNNPRRLLYLDYFYSKSFQIKPGQGYSSSQEMKINMTSFNSIRDSIETKEVFDTASGLTLILDSEQSVLEKHDQIMYPNGKPEIVKKYTTE